MKPEDNKNEIIENENQDQPDNDEDDEITDLSDDETPNDEESNSGNKNPFSVVATTPKYKKVMFAVLVVIVAAVIYYIFFGRSLTPQEQQKKKSEQIAAQREQILKSSTPVTSPSDSDSTTAKPPKAPSPPPLTAPKPPSPPPPPVPTTPTTPQSSITSSTTHPKIIKSLISSNADDQKKLKELEARRKAGIMVMGGGGGAGGESSGSSGDGSKTDHNSGKDKKKPSVGFLGFGNGSLDNNTIPKSSAEEVKATKIANLEDTVIEGTMINAVLETAINTDLPGMLRAIISRDVYGGSGSNVLIPKGSRVIGTYNSSVENGQNRIAIIWNRLIRPDGIDIAIDSPATDALGRAGVDGRLDSKFWTRIGSALLVSYVIPVVANKISGVNKNSQITTTTTTGAAGTTSTSQSSYAAQQAQRASEQVTHAGQEAIKQAFSTKPTITVNQGTEVNIFVKKDLVFPKYDNMYNSSKVMK